MAQQTVISPPGLPAFMLEPEYIRDRFKGARSEFARLTTAAGVVNAQWATTTSPTTYLTRVVLPDVDGDTDLAQAWAWHVLLGELDDSDGAWHNPHDAKNKLRVAPEPAAEPNLVDDGHMDPPETPAPAWYELLEEPDDVIIADPGVEPTDIAAEPDDELEEPAPANPWDALNEPVAVKPVEPVATGNGQAPDGKTGHMDYSMLASEVPVPDLTNQATLKSLITFAYAGIAKARVNWVDLDEKTQLQILAKSILPYVGCRNWTSKPVRLIAEALLKHINPPVYVAAVAPVMPLTEIPQCCSSKFPTLWRWSG